MPNGHSEMQQKKSGAYSLVSFFLGPLVDKLSSQQSFCLALAITLCVCATITSPIMIINRFAGTIITSIFVALALLQFAMILWYAYHEKWIQKEILQTRDK